MIHARLHLDELLLEEGLFGRDTGVLPSSSDQEEFTLAMDIPFFGGGGGGGGRAGRKALRKMQYLQLHQNRDSVVASQQSPSHLQLGQQSFDHHHHPVSLSLVSPPSATESGSVVC